MSAPNAAIRRAGQSLTPGDLIHLYIIDLNPVGYNTQFAFTPSTDRKTAVSFRGTPFTALDVKCEGFEVTGAGTLPQPKISITNANRIIGSAAVLYQDLVGANLIRIRTYKQFLDDGETPDAEAAYTPDIYRFHQKVEHNKRQLTWLLAAAMDQEGVQAPRRLVLRDLCLWRYRRPMEDALGNFTGHDYTDVECPYTGEQAYDKDGNPTTPDKDSPSRRVTTCCKVRFGANAELPFGGFAGVGRTIT